MEAIYLAMRHFLPVIWGRQVLVKTDSMIMVSYINHRGVRSITAYKSLSAGLVGSVKGCVPEGILSSGAPECSGRSAAMGRFLWHLHPQIVGQRWLHFGRVEVDLFATAQNTHCPAP